MAKHKLNFTSVVIVLALAAIFILPMLSEITGAATQLKVIKSQTVVTPQLKIISFQSRPVVPTVGSDVTLILVVKNFGGNSPATAVDFFVNGRLVKTLPLSALEQNAAETLKVTWAATAKGSYAAIATVKPVSGDNPIDNTDKITFVVV